MDVVSIPKPMFDVVTPNNNEQEFIATAVSLGYTEIVFLTTNINHIKPLLSSSNHIRVKSAYLLKDVAELQRARKNFDYVFAKAERKFFELKVDYIICVEAADRKDSFHFRSTGLNQVHAELVKSNNSTIVFSFSSLFGNSRLYSSFDILTTVLLY